MDTVFESAIFHDRGEAGAAVQELLALGYKDEIGIALHSAQAASRFTYEDESHAGRGAEAGGALGTGSGAVIAGLLAAGSVLATAATGGAAAPFVAGSLAAALLTGAGTGAVTGGFAGALIGIGLPESKANEYAVGLSEEAIVIAVRPKPGQETIVRDILSRHQGVG